MPEPRPWGAPNGVPEGFEVNARPRGPQPGDTVRVEVWGHVTERTGNTVRVHLECPPDVQRDVDTVVITQRRGEA